MLGYGRPLCTKKVRNLMLGQPNSFGFFINPYLYMFRKFIWTIQNDFIPHGQNRCGNDSNFSVPRCPFLRFISLKNLLQLSKNLKLKVQKKRKNTG